MYKIYQFVDNKPRKCFNQSANFVVDARREGDENPHTGIVAETMKFLDNSSYGFRIIGRSRHTITKYLGDGKTHKAKKMKNFFKQLNVLKNDSYEIELLKSTIEHRETIFVGFFILQYAKLRVLELY